MLSSPLCRSWHHDLINLQILPKRCHPNIPFILLWYICAGHRSFPRPCTTGSGNPDIRFTVRVSPRLLPRSYFLFFRVNFSSRPWWTFFFFLKTLPPFLRLSPFSLSSGPTGHICRSHHLKASRPSPSSSPPWAHSETAPCQLCRPFDCRRRRLLTFKHYLVYLDQNTHSLETCPVNINHVFLLKTWRWPYI